MSDALFLKEIQKSFGVEVSSIADLAGHSLPSRFETQADSQGTTLPATMKEFAATGVDVNGFNTAAVVENPDLTLEEELEAEIAFEMLLLSNGEGTQFRSPTFDSQPHQEEANAQELERLKKKQDEEMQLEEARRVDQQRLLADEEAVAQRLEMQHKEEAKTIERQQLLEAEARARELEDTR